LTLTLAHYFWGAPDVVLAGKSETPCSPKSVVMKESRGRCPWTGGPAGKMSFCAAHKAQAAQLIVKAAES